MAVKLKKNMEIEDKINVEYKRILEAEIYILISVFFM